MKWKRQGKYIGGVSNCWRLESLKDSDIDFFDRVKSPRTIYELYTHIVTYTHTYIYIYIYMGKL